MEVMEVNRRALFLSFVVFFFPHAALAAHLSMEPIQPIPQVLEVDADKAMLGEKLFFDVRLSSDNSISCAHCHKLEEEGGADGLKRSFGVEGREELTNAPTVFNAALNVAQFWDGRAETLEEQVDVSVTAHAEMASIWSDVVKKIRADADYRNAFSHLYETGVTAANVKRAIAEFERTLLTPNSSFDQYLKGDESAITAEAKRGYALFKGYGCSSCHQGRNVGGNLFQTLGVIHDYYADHAIENSADLGRFNVTGNPADKHSFKVPSLRLAVLTAPYFHNGHHASLVEVIREMAKYQLGRIIPEDDIRAIIHFLYTLPGEYRGKALEPEEKIHLSFSVHPKTGVRQ